MNFPAKRVIGERKWSSLIMNDELRKQIEEIISWLKSNKKLLKKKKRGDKVKRGYRALFYGPPGTGKTLTAALLGKEIDAEVYKVDLSLIVSKYIGETEKNIE